jgi:hypothetical protein
MKQFGVNLISFCKLDRLNAVGKVTKDYEIAELIK